MKKAYLTIPRKVSSIICPYSPLTAHLLMAKVSHDSDIEVFTLEEKADIVKHYTWYPMFSEQAATIPFWLEDKKKKKKKQLYGRIRVRTK